MANLVLQPLSSFILVTTTPNDYVSTNFTVRELVRSELATRLNLPNWFQSNDELRNAVRVCREVLQPIRDRFWPFTPNSVYRSQALERKLKGKPANWKSKSQHTRGEAADIEVSGLTNLELARWIRDHLPHDQLIAEFVKLDDPTSGWVHVSLRENNNRGEVLTFDGIRYTKGLWTDGKTYRSLSDL